MSRANRLAPSRAAGLVLCILRRELGAYFDSSIAYVTAIAFTVLASSIFMNEFFLTGSVDLTPYFDRMPYLLALLLPAITMRLWAEERRQRTLEVLLTLPLRPGQAILGKYLAALCLYGVVLAGSLPLVILLEALGNPDRGLLLAGYLGLLFLGLLLLALGSLFSALVSDQIVAFVLSSVSGLILVLLGHPRVIAVMDGLAPALRLGTHGANALSPLPRFEQCVAGLLSFSTLTYFAAWSACFLWLTRHALASRRA